MAQNWAHDEEQEHLIIIGRSVAVKVFLFESDLMFDSAVVSMFPFTQRPESKMLCTFQSAII